MVPGSLKEAYNGDTVSYLPGNQEDEFLLGKMQFSKNSIPIAGRLTHGNWFSVKPIEMIIGFISYTTIFNFYIKKSESGTDSVCL